ncbi:MAG TPA: MaoC family dehydratase [Acidimicrobiales bacterium]|nr:MaoC family dehydratase [Acidimicrobiales bacterium]
MTTTIIDGVDGLQALVGEHLGYSDWVVVDQARIDEFADATEDHQWIHVDPQRAANGPFGTTIAHGYLTLSLVPWLLAQVVRVDGVAFGVNYGCNKVRFPAPVPVDSEIRVGALLAKVEEVSGGVQVSIDVTVEVRGAEKPSCAAQVVYRYYRA